MIYIKPNGSKHHLSSTGSTSAFKYASAKEYPCIAVHLKIFFSPLLASPAVGQVTSAPAIIARSAGDEEKKITAKIGQAKFGVYHAGGVWDFSAGKVTNVAYPVWSKTVEDTLGQLLILLI